MTVVVQGGAGFYICVLFKKPRSGVGSAENRQAVEKARVAPQFCFG